MTRRSDTLEALKWDGGWLTAEGLAMDLRKNPSSVARTLNRLREKGLVEARSVDLAFKVGGWLARRQEWRALTDSELRAKNDFCSEVG